MSDPRLRASSREATFSPLDRAAAHGTRRPALVAAGAALCVHVLMAGSAVALAALRRDLPPPAEVEVSEMVEVELAPPAPLPAVEPPPPAAEPPPRVEHAPRRAVVEPRPEEPKAAEPPPVPVVVQPAPEPPPMAAQAAQVLTQAPTAEAADSATLVQGSASSYAGGTTQAGGGSAQAVHELAARAGGVANGKGSDVTAVDRSRAPGLAGGSDWASCPFPEEADLDEIDDAVVTLRVRVSPSGQVEDVTVAVDPGHGFGRQAKRCASSRRWQPGLDRAGRPVSAVSTVNVRFQR